MEHLEQMVEMERLEQLAEHFWTISLISGVPPGPRLTGSPIPHPVAPGGSFYQPGPLYHCSTIAQTLHTRYFLHTLLQC